MATLTRRFLPACRFALLIFFWTVLLADSFGYAASAASDKLSLEAQEKRAAELYKELVAADSQDFATIIRLHRLVIDHCPDTERAQESVWRLSNLYLVGYDKPDHAKVIELMRYLIERYPDSPLVPHAKQRLLRSYEDTGNMEGARLLYAEAFSHNPDLGKNPEHAAFLLGYAKTLAATGKKQQARAVYQQVIDYGDAVEEWLRDIARDALSNIK
jgi:tetratricopeptide (TPR) repeat protein